MDGDDSDRPRQHSYSISPARSLLQPLTIAIGGKKRSMEARTPEEQTALERQIAAKDRQIDALAYELYALMDVIRIWTEEYGGMNGRHLQPKTFLVEAQI